MNSAIQTLRTNALPLLKETWQQFNKHNSQWLAAALAYFAAFAIAPLVIVTVEIVGALLGSHQRVLNMIYGYLAQDAGKSAADAVKAMVTASFNQHRAGIVAEIIGWIVLLIAAIGLFSAVQFALNNAWDVEPKKTGIWEAIRQRLSAFGVMLGIAALLIVSIAVNAGLTVAASYFTHVFPGFALIIKIIDFAVSFGVVWLGFAVLFEYLPDAQIEWRDVWTGSALTAILFVVGQFLLGWYLGRAGITSGFGAFGSLVVFLIWVNYSAQIFLFGAEFTHVYCEHHGSRYGSSTAAGARGEVDYKRANASLRK